MKSFVRLFAFVLITTVAGSAATAATVTVSQMRDKALSAVFQEFIFLGDCAISSVIEMSWSDAITISHGVTTQSVTFVHLNYVNSCKSESLDMTGNTFVSSGSVNGDLGKGHLSAVVPVMTDDGSVSANVTLNLNFVGSGPITKTTNRSQSHEGNVITISNFTSQTRQGTATGSATAVFPLSRFVNLIGTPSSSATLGRGASGAITIIKKK